jgi:hypothetical protein
MKRNGDAGALGVGLRVLGLPLFSITRQKVADKKPIESSIDAHDRNSRNGVEMA